MCEHTHIDRYVCMSLEKCLKAYQIGQIVYYTYL